LITQYTLVTSPCLAIGRLTADDLYQCPAFKGFRLSEKKLVELTLYSHVVKRLSLS